MRRSSGRNVAFALALVVMASLAPGCGEDDGKVCAQSLCDPSEAAVCDGFQVRRCAAGGKAYTYSDCGGQERCSSGACVPKQCTTPGQSTCLSPKSVQLCKEDGSTFETITCGTGETCRDGACIPETCVGAGDRCTNGGFLRCVTAAWQQTNCAGGEVCVQEGTTARCRTPVCTPMSAVCDGSTAKACDARGRVETATECAEACRSGRCQVEVCDDGGTTDVVDASDTTDTTDTANLASEVIFTLNGVTSTFDQNAFVQFDPGARTLTVKASKSTRNLQITFAPANATLSGTFSSDVFNPVKVTVCYNAGGGVAGTFSRCEAAFTHESSAYSVQITKNEGTGGRFEATFEATLLDKNTDAIKLEDGQVGVKYR